MAFYRNNNSNSFYSAVEFGPVSDGNLTFFYINTPQKAEAEKWFAENKVNQKIIAESQADGQTILVTSGSKSPHELRDTLKSRGDMLDLVEARHKIDSWKVRGNMSNVGQFMQLWSAMSSGKMKADLAGFSILNLAANYVNVKFGGQKERDKYHLLYIKKNLNNLLGAHLSPGDELPNITDSHYAKHKEPEPPPNILIKFHNFMERNSVLVGEIGLRYLGSFVMAFPIDRWKTAGKALKSGSPAGALKEAINPNPTRRAAGLTYLAGKSLAFFSKTADPYNPTPPSTLEKIREKFVFRTSSVIESGAASALAVGSFTGDFGKKKPDQSDFVSGVGGSIFAGALVSRIFAPFGKKTLNVNETFAYTTDLLAKMPQDKLPQLMADSAVLLSENFATPDLDFGKVYARLMNDLYLYNNISISIEPAAKQATPANTAEPAPETATRKTSEDKEKQGFSNPSTKLLNKMLSRSMDFGSELVPGTDTSHSV